MHVHAHFVGHLLGIGAVHKVHPTGPSKHLLLEVMLHEPCSAIFTWLLSKQDEEIYERVELLLI
jgi:hypothetical protein